MYNIGHKLAGVDRAWCQHLKLNYNEPPSNYALNFDLRRYTMALRMAAVLRQLQGARRFVPLDEVGACQPMPFNSINEGSQYVSSTRHAGKCCSPAHPPHAKPSLLELNTIM